MHPYAARADTVTASATDTAIGLELSLETITELVRPEALHPLPRSGAGVVPTRLFLEALVQAGVPDPLALHAVRRAEAIPGGVAGTGRAYRRAAGAAQAAQPQSLPGIGVDASGVEGQDAVDYFLLRLLLGRHAGLIGAALGLPIIGGHRQAQAAQGGVTGLTGDQQQPVGRCVLARQQDQVGALLAYRRAAVDDAAETAGAAVQAIDAHQQGGAPARLVMRVCGVETILVGHGLQVAGMQAEQHLGHHSRQRRVELPAVEAKQQLALGEEKTLGGKWRWLGRGFEGAEILGADHLPVLPALAIVAHFIQPMLQGQMSAQALRLIQLIGVHARPRGYRPGRWAPGRAVVAPPPPARVFGSGYLSC